MPFMLGKKAAVYDPRTVRLGDYLAATTRPPRVPRSQSWSEVVPAWGAMVNDRISDCAIAAPGHAIQLWTTYTRSMPVVPPDRDIVAAYSAVSGFNPRTGANDDGCILLDVMKYWKNTGISSHKISGFASVNPQDPAQITTAIFLFGGVVAGLRLPATAQQQIAANQPWTVTSGQGSQPGSWGGHAIYICDYDNDMNDFRCITWGKVQSLDYGFTTTYGDEMYAMLTQDWMFKGKVSPSGFDYATLQKDITMVG